jgi:hypothetical protein
LNPNILWYQNPGLEGYYRVGEGNLPKMTKRGILWVVLRQHSVHMGYTVVAPIRLRNC